MTPSRQAELRTILEERRRLLEEQVRQKMLTLRDTARGITARRVTDCSDDPQQDDVDLAFLQLQVRAMDQVGTALARLASRTYGVCETCGGDIPAKRLEAFPLATRCRSCQELEERALQPARLGGPGLIRP